LLLLLLKQVNGMLKVQWLHCAVPADLQTSESIDEVYEPLGVTVFVLAIQGMHASLSD
jgi:hypothetical protein